MREIKFRAWDVHEKVMRDWESLIIDKENGNEWWLIGYQKNKAITAFDHEQVLLQCTGIKDENGVEIYDGDIVQYFRNELAVIVFQNGGVDIRSLSWMECEPLQRRMGFMKVLGNIYENPELLEREAE